VCVNKKVLANTLTFLKELPMCMCVCGGGVNMFVGLVATGSDYSKCAECASITALAGTWSGLAMR
jgi:hypothetical protein